MKIIGISGLTYSREFKGSAGAGKDETSKIFIENGYVQIALADVIKRFVMEVFDWSPEILWGPSENRTLKDDRYNGLMPRNTLQDIGETLRRLYPEVWVRYLQRNISKIKNGCQYVNSIGVIPDMMNIIYPGDQATLIQPVGMLSVGDLVNVESIYGNDYVISKCDFYEVASMSMLRAVPKTVKGIIITDCRYINELDILKNEVGVQFIRVKRFVETFATPPEHISEIDLANIPDSYYKFVIDNDGTIEDLRAKAMDIYRLVEDDQGFKEDSFGVRNDSP